MRVPRTPTASRGAKFPFELTHDPTIPIWTHQRIHMRYDDAQLGQGVTLPAAMFPADAAL